MDILSFAQQSEVKKAVDIEVMANKINQLMLHAYVSCIKNKPPTYQMFLDLIKLSIGFSYSEKITILNLVDVSNKDFQIIDQAVNEHDSLLDEDSSVKGLTSYVGKNAILSLNFNKPKIILDPKFDPFLVKFLKLIDVLINEKNLTVIDARSKYLESFPDLSIFPKYITPNTLCAVLYAVRPDVFPLINQYIATQLKTLIGKFDPSPQGYIKAAQDLDAIKEKISPSASFGAIDRALSMSKESQPNENGSVPLDEIFKLILQRYNDVKESVKYGKNNDIGGLFEAAVNKLNESWEDYPEYKAFARYGQGDWADVPYISICEKDKAQDDKRLTSFTYIFAKDGTSVYLTVMAASKAIKKRFKENPNAKFDEIAQHIKALYRNLPQLGIELSAKPAIASDTERGKDLIAGVSAWKRYDIDDMPSEEQLLSDAHELFSIYDQYLQDNTDENTGDEMGETNLNGSSEPLNQILFGAAGTGKTFNTINKALQITAPQFLAENSSESDRPKLKACFDELMHSKRIRFVTFHQSFSYEDFVEGIRADNNDKGELFYKPEAGVFKQICDAAKNDKPKPYVLIIDEINRGNISRIFGELITLIEDSKRAGADEALSVTLPYSKDTFSVPQNVYIIGTMNSSDRSLTGLDIALRRRFDFIEMQPDPTQLSGVKVADIQMDTLLSVMNDRIEVLLDRDRCIGHAYFMPLKKDASLSKLSHIFQQKIIPLLQEYFYDNWEHIDWVLNSNGMIKKDERSLSTLFSNIDQTKLQNNSWKIENDVFNDISAYQTIIGASK